MSKKNATKPPRILKVRKDRDYDCVYIGKKKIMLGRTGSPEAEAALMKIQVQVLTDPALSFLCPKQITVDHLCLAYLQYAKEHDLGHYSSIKTASEILLRLAAGQSVESLDRMFAHYLRRRSCNFLCIKH
jgi:hypothetical protein